MGYGGKDLKTELLTFAARKLVSKAIDTVARHTENSIKTNLRKQKTRRGIQHMAVQRENATARFDAAPTRTAARTGSTNADREPIEFWVNTVWVDKDGGDPVRFLTGRGLQYFNDNRDVNTNSEDMNTSAVLSNAFIQHMRNDAAKMELGEAKFYSPHGGAEWVAVDDKDPDSETLPYLKKGIYIQLYRDKNDAEQEAAIKMDAEGAKRAQLQQLFG